MTNDKKARERAGANARRETHQTESYNSNETFIGRENYYYYCYYLLNHIIAMKLSSGGIIIFIIVIIIVVPFPFCLSAFCDLLLCCCWSRKICSRDSNKINNYVARGRIHWESRNRRGQVCLGTIVPFST